MRSRDYRDFNKALTGDFHVFVRAHPDAIDVLLFKPDMESLEKVAVDQDVVGALEAEERSLDYNDPVLTKAVIVPDDIPFGVTDAGDEPDGNMTQPAVLLIAEPDVPKQSVVQYREYVNDTDVRIVSLYVLRSEAVGEAPGACEKHYCVPFRAFDYVLIEPPANESPEDWATNVSTTPTLVATEFAAHGTTDDFHEKSQWQVRMGKTETYLNPVYDSGMSADLRSHVVPAGKLVAGGHIYSWRVRYRGASVWSVWSEETAFTTEG